MIAAPTPTVSLRRLAMEHLSIVIAVASATVVMIRALSISNFDPETTLAVLSSANLAGLIIGSVVLLLPVFAPLVIAFIPRLARQVPGSGNPFVEGSALGLITVAVALVVPAVTFLLAAIVVLPGTLILSRRRRRFTAADPAEHHGSLRNGSKSAARPSSATSSDPIAGGPRSSLSRREESRASGTPT